MLASGRRADGRENEAEEGKERGSGGGGKTQTATTCSGYMKMFSCKTHLVLGCLASLPTGPPPPPYPLRVARIFISNFLIELWYECPLSADPQSSPPSHPLQLSAFPPAPPFSSPLALISLSRKGSLGRRNRGNGSILSINLIKIFLTESLLTPSCHIFQMNVENHKSHWS